MKLLNYGLTSNQCTVSYNVLFFSLGLWEAVLFTFTYSHSRAYVIPDYQTDLYNKFYEIATLQYLPTNHLIMCTSMYYIGACNYVSFQFKRRQCSMNFKTFCFSSKISTDYLLIM